MILSTVPIAPHNATGIAHVFLDRFKEAYHKLKEMKSEVEHMQHLLERAKVQLQKDFEVWWEDEAKKMRQVSYIKPLTWWGRCSQ